MGYPCTTNHEAFEVLHAPTSPHFADRIRQVEVGKMDLIEAQRMNAEDGFQKGELVQSAMRGWAVINRMQSLGGPGWFTPFSQSVKVAMIAAEAWYNEDRERREVIILKKVLQNG